MHNWSLHFHLETAVEITEEENVTTLSPFNDDKKLTVPIVDTCLHYEDTARQSCAMVPKWRFFVSLFSEPHTAHFRHAF